MRVAVIGAGAGGLAAAKALCEVGLRPVVYERSHQIGGLWLYRENGGGPAYRSLHTNTSKQITAFSDAPFPRDLADFPHWTAVAEYLQGYAARFDLLPLVRFGCSVRSLTPLPGGRWSVLTSGTGGETAEVFDAVLVCSGIFTKPAVPAVNGLESFAGCVLHSVQYRVPEAFAGKNVVVVGLGSSAVDIASDLASTAARVTVSARRGVWLAPRQVAGRPLDHRGTRLSLLLPPRVRLQLRRRLLVQEYRRRELESPEAIWSRAKVAFDPDSAPSVTSDSLLPAIMAGKVAVRPPVARVENGGLVFADGSRLRPDVIIFCTGYRLDFPFLGPELQPWRDSGSGLYRLVFPVEHPTLAFIGVCRVHGPVLPIVEMQARWAARVLTREVGLPSPAAMRAEISDRWQAQTARGDSPFRVPLIPYLDQLGGVIGVRPTLWRHPGLLPSLLLGPPVAAQFRLEGPDSWPGAPEVLRYEGAPPREDTREQYRAQG